MSQVDSSAVPIITIDGPSGSGKGTISKQLANRLGWRLLDSGALYRLTALAASHHGVALDNEAALVVLAAHLDVQFNARPHEDEAQIILEGEEVTQAIRAENVGKDASNIAVLSAVRTALLDRQRAFAEPPGLVADGRDMGTVVFPQAALKIYLDASLTERSRRRHKQLSDKGVNSDLESIHQDLQLRDMRDKNREIAPLRPAEDAVVIDSSDMSIDDVLASILEAARHRGLR